MHFIYTGEPPVRRVHINIPYSNGKLCSQIFELSAVFHHICTIGSCAQAQRFSASYHVEQSESHPRPRIYNRLRARSPSADQREASRERLMSLGQPHSISKQSTNQKIQNVSKSKFWVVHSWLTMRPFTNSVTKIAWSDKTL